MKVRGVLQEVRRTGRGRAVVIAFVVSAIAYVLFVFLLGQVIGLFAPLAGVIGYALTYSCFVGIRKLMVGSADLRPTDQSFLELGIGCASHFSLLLAANIFLANHGQFLVVSIGSALIAYWISRELGATIVKSNTLAPRWLWNNQRYWAPAAIFFLITSAVSLLFYARVPVMDHWDIVPFYQSYVEGKLTLREVFALHGLHWHASGYIVMLALASVTRMAHFAEVLAMLFLSLLAFVAFAQIINRTAVAIGNTKYVAFACGVGALFFFSLDQADNYFWGWQVALFVTIAGALWCINLLSRNDLSHQQLFLAIFCAAVAIYGFAIGWVLLPIGFVLLLVHGGWQTARAKLHLMSWMVFAVLMLLHLSIAVQDAGLANGGTGSSTSGISLWQSMIFLFNFSVAPMVKFSEGLALPVLFATGWYVIRAFFVGQKNIGIRLKNSSGLIAIAMFSLGAGALTALGRATAFGAEQGFVARYISFGGLLWAAMLGFVLLSLSNFGSRERQIGLGLVVVLLGLKLGNIAHVANNSIEHAVIYNAVAETITQTYPDVSKEAIEVVAAPHQEVSDRMLVLYENRASLFKGASHTASE